MSQKRKRPYSSPLRQQQAAVTHRRIIDAAIALLTARPGSEISHESVGRAAAIAVRTVYRHFPTRSDLLDEVWEELDQRLGLSKLPTTGSAALVEFVPELFARLDANAALVNALITSNTGHEMSRRTGERRLEAIERSLADETSHLPRAERNRLIGLVRVLTSPMTWHVLHEKTRVTGDEPARAVMWALRQLIAATERR
ncbi:MAG TPA: TetR family transcriptional regulator [Gemmatimonadaceae bacterium]|jgi:AcrR family transcriptional regulator